MVTEAQAAATREAALAAMPSMTAATACVRACSWIAWIITLASKASPPSELIRRVTSPASASSSRKRVPDMYDVSPMHSS